MIKKVGLLISIFMLCSCVAQKAMVELPSKDSDFTMNKADILQAFPSVKANNIEYVEHSESQIPEFTAFKKQWGEPVSEKKEWLMHAALIAAFTGIGYTGLESSPTAFALFETVFLLPRLFPPQTYTWDKGDYLIDVTFSNPTFGDSKQAQYWRWRHKNDKNDDWLRPDVEKPFYFLMGYSSGGDDVFASIDGSIKHSMGFGTTMMLGYEYQLPSIGDYSIRAAAGIKYSGIVIPQAGAKLVEYPIDVIFMSKLGDTPAYFGAGLSYKLNPSLYQFTASNSKLELDNTFSGVVQLEYKSVSSSSVVFRYEYLTYSSNTTIDIKANNFGTYFVRYF